MDNHFVSCPYNPAHQVLRSRIQGHIVKCEKKYPPLERCPYNASHRIPKSELHNHVANCPTRLEYIESPNKVVFTKPNSRYTTLSSPDDECWD